MSARVGYAAVGAFVLLLGAALVASALWLGTRDERGQFETYLAYPAESVSGLATASRVTYKGVDVGSVAAIELDPQDPTRVRLTFSLRAGTPVKTDTQATIAMQGLTGLGSVELTGGSRDAPPLRAAPGEPYPVIPMKPSLFTRLDTALRVAVTSLDQVSERLLVILSDENTRAIAATLEGAGAFSTALAAQAPRLERTLADLERLADAGAQAAAGLPELSARVNDMLVQADAAVTALRQSAESVGALAGQSRSQLEYSGAVLLPQAEALLDELRAASAAIAALGEGLSTNPQAVLTGPPQPAPGPGE